jgi:hypothetical protein
MAISNSFLYVYQRVSPNTANPGKVTAGKQLGPEFFGKEKKIALQR